SIGIIAAARSGFLVARDPNGDDPNTCVMAHVKANLGPIMPSLVYRIKPVATEVGQVACISFTGETTCTAEDLLRADQSSKSVVENCMDYLRNALASGPVYSKELEKSGYSKSTLNRAKAELGIKSVKDDFGGDWKWQLEGIAQ